jgi:two-component system LytT family response regulator
MDIFKPNYPFQQDRPMFNVLIADDERIAREIIKLLLAEQPDIAQVFEAKDGYQTLECALKYQPDIIFLDIQMPGPSGIQLADKLPAKSNVIFVTAYDKYAIEAFELCAIDYLLKPFQDERFNMALDKVRRHTQESVTQMREDMGHVLGHLVEQRNEIYKTRLIVKVPGRIHFIEVKFINYITGAGNYAEVHLFDGSFVLHRETLANLEKQLDPGLFVRIHRSSIVRLTSICKLQPNQKGDYSVLLKSGEALTLSRDKKAIFSELLSN